MRTLDVKEITQAVRDLCIEANKVLPDSIATCMEQAKQQETNELAGGVLDDLLRNLDAAKELDIPICQDTGMAVVFVEIGQEVQLVGGNFEQAVNDGVARGYTEGYLRCSIVADPLERKNTNDNTPAVIHTRIVPGDQVKLTVAPKGFGSENMSRSRMFTPAATPADIVHYVVECVEKAGSNPCPPVIVGVGIGGNFESCAYLAKRALCRDISRRNPKSLYRGMEAQMLEQINQTSIGPQGFGGLTTALAVNIEEGPTHIAGLPVAVNMGCHVTRHASVVL